MKMKYVADGPNQFIVYNKGSQRCGHICKTFLNSWVYYPVRLNDFPCYFSDEMIAIGRKLSSLTKAKPNEK